MYDVHNRYVVLVPEDTFEPLIHDRPEPTGSGPRLSRATIVRAAVEIADTEGAEALTMRRIATALGSSTPMSLYRYVGSKDGLVDLVLDEVYGEIHLPANAPDDWREGLRTFARASWAAMRRHPWFAALSHHRPPLGPNALRRIEFALAAMSSLDATPERRMSYVAIVDGLCFGHALQAGEEAKMRANSGLATDCDPATDNDLAEAAAPYHRRIIASGAYPAFSAWLESGAGYDNAADFDFVLDCLLEGLATRAK